jgi:hypothetical protein
MKALVEEVEKNQDGEAALRESSKTLLFLGAGASKPFGLPTMREMFSEIKSLFSDFTEEIGVIEQRLQEVGFIPDLEALLTVLVGLSGKRQAIEECGPFISMWPYLTKLSATSWCEIVPRFDGNGSSHHKQKQEGHVSATIDRHSSQTVFNNVDRARQAVDKIKAYIRQRCQVQSGMQTQKLVDIYDQLFEILCEPGIGGFRIVPHMDKRDEVTGFSIEPVIDSSLKKISAKGYHYDDLDVFTTNYDLCLETYFSIGEIPYLSGFDLINKETSETDSIKIWKLHGSIDRYMTARGDLIQLPLEPRKKPEIDQELMIYPGYGKNIYRDPYMELLYQLKKRLKTCGVCVVVGYSFRDNAINSVFRDSLLTNERMKIIVLSPNAKSVIKENASYMYDRAIPINQPFGDPGSMIEVAQKLRRVRKHAK